MNEIVSGCVHTSPEKFENTTITSGHFGFVFEERLRIIDYCDFIVFESSVFKMFSVHTKTHSRRFRIFLVCIAFLKCSVFVTDFLRSA